MRDQAGREKLLREYVRFKFIVNMQKLAQLPMNTFICKEPVDPANMKKKDQAIE